MAQQAPKSKIDAHGIRVSPASQARIIHLLQVEGLSIRIVAHRFGISRSTVVRIRADYQKKGQDE